MGIRGLVHHLQPYRVAVEFPESRQSSTTTHVQDYGRGTGEAAGESQLRHKNSGKASTVNHVLAVLDGPALAFQAYYCALARRPYARNAFEAMPFYAEVNHAAIEYLETLEQHGVRVGAIFFDGVLPSYKTKTRMERLESSVRQLEKYRSQYSKPRPTIGITHGGILHPDSVFSAHQMPARLMALPALPFLVASVIDALRASRFGALTSVVPDEADGYCAAYARAHDNAMIITSDSDLIVYDIGRNGSVLLWKDIELSSSERGSYLQCLRFEPHDIAERMGLATILPFAFAVHEDSHLSDAACIARAQKVKDYDNAAFRHFQQLYDIAHIDYRAIVPSDYIRSLDPRISEFVHQLLKASQHESETGIPLTQTQLDAYMPILTDDPSRASALNASLMIRSTAYSTLMLGSASRSSAVVKEILRKGSGLSSQTIVCLNAKDVATNLQSMTQMLDQAEYEAPKPFKWTFLALRMLCTHLGAEGKAIPSRDDLKWLLLNQRPNGQAWDRLYLSAQVQGIYYSLRMLKQHIELALSQPSEFGTCSIEENTSCERLSTMPDVAELFDPLPGNFADNEMAVLVERLLEGLPTKDAEDTEWKEETKKRKRAKKESKESQPKALKGSKAPANIFDLLADA